MFIEVPHGMRNSSTEPHIRKVSLIDDRYPWLVTLNSLANDIQADVWTDRKKPGIVKPKPVEPAVLLLGLLRVRLQRAEFTDDVQVIRVVVMARVRRTIR